MRQILLGILLLLFPTAQRSPVEPIVRIGLTQNAASVTVRSAQAFTLAGRSTRTATFAAVLAAASVSYVAVSPANATDYYPEPTPERTKGNNGFGQEKQGAPQDGGACCPPASPILSTVRSSR